jgi:hypothetical protein
MIPEGLDRRPLKELVGELVKNKFNCVRLTYAIYMWTRYEREIVNETFSHLDAPEVVDGISKYNPSIMKMTHIEAFDAVVNELGNQNIKVLLDNHVSEPKWCCHDDDENGFFHDRHFCPQEWIGGLTLAAQHFNGHHAVCILLAFYFLHFIPFFNFRLHKEFKDYHYYYLMLTNALRTYVLQTFVKKINIEP